ncbi:MAG: hypothetical protein Fur0022_08110 [Anaerolineales bacterium]
MGVIHKLIWLALLAGILFGFPAGARAASPADDEIIFGGTFTLASGQKLDGNLIVFGGTVMLEDGSHITGEVVIYGGTTTLNGTVDEDIVLSGGTLILGEHADVRGDVYWHGGTLDQDNEANITGEIIAQPGRITRPDFETSLAGRLGRRILDTLWSFFLLFAFSALAVLVVIFFPNPTGRVAQTLVAQPGQSALVGLMTLIVAFPVLLILAITILLIPVSFLGILGLVIAGIFGWIALGLETGNRLARAFRQDWAPPVAAGLGTFLLTFVAFSLKFIFGWLCIGWIFPTVVGLVGLGAVVLSQFGKRVYHLAQ